MGRNSPDVRIRTNSASAVAQLSAVSRAVRGLQDAQGRELVAEAKLAELRASGTASASRMARAEEDVARARRAVADQTIRLAQAHNQNDDATRRETQSTNDATKATLGLKDAIIALGPAIVPVGAVAVGALAGIAPAAASAMLAVLGVKDAWKSGALEGSAFAGQVHVMNSEFTTLKQTAAAGVLPGLTGAMMALQPLFGSVNGLVSIFSGDLGMIAQILAPALVQIFTQLEPLFTTFGNVLVTGAAKLANWVETSSGVQDFGNYIISQLPAVLHTLGQLLDLVGHLAAAFAPIGTVVVDALGLVAQVLNAIPVNVLTGLAAAALAAYAAFKVFAIAAVIIDTVRAAMRALATATLSTWIGAFLALIGTVAAFVIGMNAANGTTADAKQVMDSYADSVKQSVDALAAVNQAQTLKNLTDKDALTTLDQLHGKNQLLTLSYQDLVQAVNGSDTDLKRVIDRLSALVKQDPFSATGKQAAGLLATIGSLHVGLQGQISTTEAYNAAQRQQQSALQGTDAATASMARSLHTTTDAYLAAKQAAQQNTQQAAAQTLQYQLENDAADLLKQSLDRLSGKSIDLAQAQNTLDSALVNMGDHTTATGKKIHFTTTSINDMSAASVELRGQLNGQVTSAESVAEAYGQLKGSSEAGREKLVALRQEIINNAVAHGVDRQAVTNYIDSILHLSKLKVPPTKFDIDKSRAEAALAALKRELAAITAQRYQINVEAVASGGVANLPNGVKAKAAGGPIEGPGPRGVDSVPLIGAPGEWVINDRSVAKYGVPFMRALNSGTLQMPAVPVATTGQAAPSPAMPSVLVVVDSDGQLIGRMRVEAQQTVAHNARQVALTGGRL